ncbi:hypothetical protein Taro_039478 [Colocasia esculenta]|uniref:Uncharacterized protein n=1 Tax=Colocasia esculenta TaxID=4460 RepID=A0A843WGQ9_COLES|nr:hypothetical protein [Colocasia esculenta]
MVSRGMACCQLPDARKYCPSRRGFRHKPSRPCSEGGAFVRTGWEAPGGGFWVPLPEEEEEGRSSRSSVFIPTSLLAKVDSMKSFLHRLMQNAAEKKLRVGVVSSSFRKTWWGIQGVVVPFCCEGRSGEASRVLYDHLLGAMGRKKSHPIRSGGVLPIITSSKDYSREETLENGGQHEAMDVKNIDGDPLLRRHLFVDVDSSHWASDEHFDIAEVVLEDIKFTNEVTNHILIEHLQMTSNISLRFRLPDIEHESLRLGHWPVFSVDNIFLEFVDLEMQSSEDKYMSTVLFSGVFDGPHDSVSGLVHLVSMKFMTLRPVSQIRVFHNISSLRLRVEIMRNAFDACESLLEVARHSWRKSMINVMSWLRPEVTTSEAKYRIRQLDFDESCMQAEEGGNMVDRVHSVFDAACFYEAIKPSK